MPPAPTTWNRSTPASRPREMALSLTVFLQVAFKLLSMFLFGGQKRDGQILCHVVFAVSLLDDEAVLSDGVFFRLENAADHIDDVGGIGGRLQGLLIHFELETSRHGTAELLDAVA